MPPIISCLPNSYGRFGTRAAIGRLRTMGLEYIELPIRTAETARQYEDDPLVTTDSTSDDLQRVDQLLQEHRVSVCSCNITSGNPLNREVVEITKRKLDLAAHFGVDRVVGGAGEAENDKDLHCLYEHLRTIGDHAALRGITYCCETHPGLCQNHLRMIETMQRLDHPQIKINFDTGNLLYYNEQIHGEVALAKVCHLVRHVHLKDSQGEFGKWYFPALGEGGAVDFVRVLEILRDSGFRGPYSLEIEGIAGEPELSPAGYHRRVAESVEYLRTCGYFD